MNAYEKRLTEMNKKALEFHKFTMDIVSYFHDCNGEKYSFDYCYNIDLYGVMARLNMAFLNAMSKEYNLGLNVSLKADGYYHNGSWRNTQDDGIFDDFYDENSFSSCDFDQEYSYYTENMKHLLCSFSPYAVCKIYPLFTYYEDALEYYMIEHDLSENDMDDIEKNEDLQKELEKIIYEDLTEGFITDGDLSECLITKNIDFEEDSAYYEAVCCKNTLVPHFLKWYQNKKKHTRFIENLYQIIMKDIDPEHLTIYGEYCTENTPTARYHVGIVGYCEDTGDCLMSENLCPSYIIQQLMICDSILYLDERYHFLPDKEKLVIRHSKWISPEEQIQQKKSRKVSDSLIEQLTA